MENCELEIIAQLERNDASIKQRRRLLRDLRTLSTERSIGVLKAALYSGDHKSVVAAVYGLEHVEADEATDVLIECCAISSGPPLTWAAHALASRDARRAVPALVRCMDERVAELSQSDIQMIIGVLAAAPHRSEVPVLVAALHAPSRRTRNMAAHALARIRAPESREALENAARRFGGRQARRALRLHQE